MTRVTKLAARAACHLAFFTGLVSTVAAQAKLFEAEGTDGQELGHRVSAAGDVNGDGFDDGFDDVISSRSGQRRMNSMHPTTGLGGTPARSETSTKTGLRTWP